MFIRIILRGIELISVYVDYILIFPEFENHKNSIVSEKSHAFEIFCSRIVDWYLSVSIFLSNYGHTFGQAAYIEYLLEENYLKDSKLVTSQMVSNF